MLQTQLGSGCVPPAGAYPDGWQVALTEVVIHHGLASDAGMSWLASIRLDLASGTKHTYVDLDGSGRVLSVYGARGIGWRV